MPHCEKGYLCGWCRPCACDCTLCVQEPMTDNRPMSRGRHPWATPSLLDEELSKKEASRTSIAFRDALIALARGSRGY